MSSEAVKVVPASGALPAPGADNIVGTYQAPNPGAQPGEVSDQPLTAQSAADPDPQASVDANKVDDKDRIQTADDPHPEATAKGATDPAVHNPRGPLDGSGVGNDGQPAVATRVEKPADEPTNDEVHLHNRNAHRGVAAGPSSEPVTRPVRRDEV
jgi:hypothetical protein